MLLAVIALLCAGSSTEVFMNTVFVEMKQPAEIYVADHVAARNGFVNLESILGSQTEYHFVHKVLPHARNKRSVPHMKRLKVDPLVHRTVQQSGFKRVKRGYKTLSVDNLVPPYQMRNPANPGDRDPSDPFFQYQWYWTKWWQSESQESENNTNTTNKYVTRSGKRVRFPDRLQGGFS